MPWIIPTHEGRKRHNGPVGIFDPECLRFKTPQVGTLKDNGRKIAAMRRIAFLAPLMALSACSPTPESAPPSETVEPQHIAEYVALGDSYAAMGSTTLPLQPADNCAKAEDSYPELLNSEEDFDIFRNATCQGATTMDVLAGNGRPPQVDAVGEGTQLITLSIGGNDTSFGMLTRCFSQPDPNQSCEQARSGQAELELQGLPERLDKVYAELQQRAPDAHIIATGYLPLIVEGETCAEVEHVTASDRDWLAGIITRINDEVREAAERHDAEFVLPDDAANHTGCSPEPWADFTGQDTDSFPMHPTHAGQVAMTEAIVKQLRS